MNLDNLDPAERATLAALLAKADMDPHAPAPPTLTEGVVVEGPAAVDASAEEPVHDPAAEASARNSQAIADAHAAADAAEAAAKAADSGAVLEGLTTEPAHEESGPAESSLPLEPGDPGPEPGPELPAIPPIVAGSAWDIHDAGRGELDYLITWLRAHPDELLAVRCPLAVADVLLPALADAGLASRWAWAGEPATTPAP